MSFESRALILGLIASLIGCSPAAPVSDGGTDGAPTASDAAHDASAASDAGPPMQVMYVASTFSIPVTNAQATMLGADLDGDGAVDNALGRMLVSLHDLQTQDDVDTAVRRGETIVLLEVVAPSLTTGEAHARLLEGTDPMPAPCTDDTDTTCGHHLTGTGTFTVLPPATEGLTGTITAGALAVGPGSGRVPIFLLGTAAWMASDFTRLHGTISATGWASGTIVGSVQMREVSDVLLPAFVAGIAPIVARDCTSTGCTSGSTGATLLSLFDANGDGAVSVSELQSNSVLASVLAPDLDLYDASGAPGTDGVAESLSFGFGFTGVLGTFPDP